MGLSHHGDKSELMRRFEEQLARRAKRKWSAGRMGGDDDGDLAYAITTDRLRGVVVIDFGKPVEWIGLGVTEIRELIDGLSERLCELQAGK